MLINGHNLNVEIYGAGTSPWVVLLHHGLGSTAAWRFQIPALLTAGFSVLVYDRWGYGQSDARSSLDLPFFQVDCQDLKALMDCLGIGGASLVGHSDGGTLALYYAAGFPQRVNRLVMVAAHIYLEPKMEAGICALRQSFQLDQGFRSRLRQIHHGQEEQVFFNWFNGWRRAHLENLNWDMRPLLKQLDFPTLVVQGCQDEFASAQHARDLAEAIPGAELWLFEAGGHNLPQEKPELFNKRMVAFFNGSEM